MDGAHGLGGHRQVLPVFGGALDVADWRARHADGHVPDAVPYGLDRLGAHGWELVEEPPGWLGTASAQLARGAVRRGGGGYDWLLAASGRPRADVVLSWDERRGVPLAVAHGRSVPVVTNVIWATDARAGRPAVHRAAALGLRRAARLAVLSSAQVPALVERFGVREASVRVVPFGVDADFFTPGPAPADPDLVVTVGNDRHRDWPTALAAFAHVRQRRPAARLVVVSRTAGAAVRLDRVDGVEVVEHLPHPALRDLLRTAGAVLVTTRPNLHASGITAVLEALATARPAVGTATAGMADYAPRGGGLSLVPPGDAVAAGQALLDLLRDPDRADGQGAAGRRSVEERFSTARQAVHLAQLLAEAVDGPSQ